MSTILRTGYASLAKLSKRFSRANLYEWLEAELATLPQGSQVLCIGAGGLLDSMIKGQAGIEATTVDIDPARKPDIVMDATQLTFDNESFDAVFMLEVLEHVVEPKAALNEVNRVLKPGGRFVISTPFVFGIHEAPYDFWRFTRHGLEHLLAEYSDVSIRVRNHYYESIIVLLTRSIFSEGKKRQLIGGLVIILGLPLFAVLLLLDRMTRDDQSTTGYFATCVKPD